RRRPIDRREAPHLAHPARVLARLAGGVEGELDLLLRRRDTHRLLGDGAVRVAGEGERDGVTLAGRRLEGLLQATEAGRAVQLDAALAVRRLPVDADDVDGAARDRPALEVLAAGAEREIVADGPPLLEATVDEEVRLLARGRRPEDPAGDGEDGQRGKGFHVV